MFMTAQYCNVCGKNICRFSWESVIRQRFLHWNSLKFYFQFTNFHLTNWFHWAFVNREIDVFLYSRDSIHTESTYDKERGNSRNFSVNRLHRTDCDLIFNTVAHWQTDDSRRNHVSFLHRQSMHIAYRWGGSLQWLIATSSDGNKATEESRNNTLI